jgi:hypothetical protein
MSPIPYHIVSGEDGRTTITVYYPGDGTDTIDSDHPKFEEAQNKLLAQKTFPIDAEELRELTNLEEAATKAFQQLSERVTVKDGAIQVDGDPLRSSIAEHILRALREGASWTPLVKFLEKVLANPSQRSRAQLYDWLQRSGKFTITTEGDIIGYKGFHSVQGSGGAVVPGRMAPVFVNGESRSPGVQSVGDVVTLPRSKVNSDEQKACSSGLHVSTHSYAARFAENRTLIHEVIVNPRDVVSVPAREHNKMRVCRYVLGAFSERPRTEAVEATEEAAKPYTQDDNPHGWDWPCGLPFGQLPPSERPICVRSSAFTRVEDTGLDADRLRATFDQSPHDYPPYL